MIGIFDSGVGGFNAFYEVRRALPLCDIAYLADRKNAPYGTKNEEEILRLVKEDIRRLRRKGAQMILIACCTASTVYDKLSEEEKSVSVPIISPAAGEAALGERIAVIATERTVKDGAFAKEILKIKPTASVTELPTQSLVEIVERGARSGALTPEWKLALDGLCHRLKADDPDTLVLGCTHFSHLEREFQNRLPGVRTVSPARVGAKALVDLYKKAKKYSLRERGRIIYTT